MLELDRDRIVRALSLFGDGALDEPNSLTIVIDQLSGELELRRLVLAQIKPAPAKLNRIHAEVRFLRYVSFRLQEVFARLSQLNWMRAEFAGKAGEEAAPWRNFAALAIKDFHIDLASLMDAVVPATLQVVGAFDASTPERLPGFSQVQSEQGGRGRPGGRRKDLPSGILRVIDSTDTWWPSVKEIRDILVHREHDKIVFGSAGAGILFQFYSPGSVPAVLDSRLLWPEGKNVADFQLYSAAVLGELFLFLDELGRALADTKAIAVEGMRPSFRAGDFAHILSPLKELLAALEV